MTRTGIATLAALLLASTLSHADHSNWTLASATDPASYQVVSTLSQNSLTTISDEYGVKEVLPRLEFYCVPAAGDALHARINWQRFISSFNTEVTFVADGAEPLTLKLGVDRTNKITTAGGAEDVAALIELVSGHDSMTIKVTPYSEAPLAVEFDISGFSHELPRLATSCKT